MRCWQVIKLIPIGFSVGRCGNFRLPTRLFSYSPSSSALPLKQLRYNAVEISLLDFKQWDNPVQFKTNLATTLRQARDESRSAVYLKLPTHLGALIPLAAEAGFIFHHAEGKEATMLLWLENTRCKVPPFATHQVGVGAAVVKGSQLLVVREKDRGNFGIVSWKLPGGLVDIDEDLSDAAAREVLEETGVRASFVEVLSFRHSRSLPPYGRSDMYVICRMNAMSEEIFIDDEIADAKWMELSEFLSNNKYPMLTPIAKILLDNATKGFPTNGFLEHTVISSIPGRKPSKYYLSSKGVL